MKKTKFINFKQISLFVLSSMLIAFLGIFSDSAYAASDYDNVIRIGGNSNVSLDFTAAGGICGAQSPKSQDATNTWAPTLIDQTKWYGAALAISDKTSIITAFQDAVASGEGWGVVQLTAPSDYINPNGSSGALGQGDTYLEIYFSDDPILTFNTYSAYPSPGNYKMLNMQGHYYVATMAYTGTPNPGESCEFGVTNVQSGTGKSVNSGIATQYEGYTDMTRKAVFMNFNIDFDSVSGYEGQYPSDGSDIDDDGDGLNMIQELQQGTSDNNIDTDGDGIDDFKESIWYPDRDDVFCKTTVTPHVCAYPDPTVKDVYVEIDWMNDGARDYKPTSGQLSTVVDAFAEQSINAHFDTGEYGGGQELSAPTGDLYFIHTDDEADFYDFKNGTSTTDPTFSPDRKGIWHYMITSMDYMNNIDENTGLPAPGTSGSSFAGDDDSIVSIEESRGTAAV